MATSTKKAATTGKKRPKKYEEPLKVDGDFMTVIKAAGKAKKNKDKKRT
jgi:hypothetical protein